LRFRRYVEGVLGIGILKKVRIFHNDGDVVKEIGGLRRQ